MSLEKLLRALGENSTDCDDVGSVAKKIENQKYRLARDIRNREMFFEVVNFATVMQSNIYSMAGLLWDEDKPVDEVIKELYNACTVMIEQNAKTLDKAFKAIKEDRKKDRDNDE